MKTTVPVSSLLKTAWVACALLFFFGSGCASSSSGIRSSGSDSSRRVYRGSLQTVVEQIAETAANLNLDVEDVSQTDSNVYTVKCVDYRSLESMADGEDTRVQVAQVNVLARKVSDREVEVLVESSTEKAARSPGLGGSRFDGGMRDYASRFFKTMDRSLVPREEAEREAAQNAG